MRGFCNFHLYKYILATPVSHFSLCLSALFSCFLPQICHVSFLHRIHVIFWMSSFPSLNSRDSFVPFLSQVNLMLKTCVFLSLPNILLLASTCGCLSSSLLISSFGFSISIIKLRLVLIYDLLGLILLATNTNCC